MAGLGDISEVGDSEQIGRDALEQPEDKADFLPELVKLVAGAFYFRRVGRPRIRSDGTFSCTGQICCEFVNGSLVFWVFWDYFGNQLKNHSKICFDIESDTEESQVITAPITASDIYNLQRNTVPLAFDVPEIRVRSRSCKVRISMYLRGASSCSAKYLISGFPRAIMEYREMPIVKHVSSRLYLDPAYDLATWADNSGPRGERSERGSYYGQSAPLTSGEKSTVSEYPFLEERDHSIISHSVVSAEIE